MVLGAKPSDKHEVPQHMECPILVDANKYFENLANFTPDERN